MNLFSSQSRLGGATGQGLLSANLQNSFDSKSSRLYSHGNIKFYSTAWAGPRAGRLDRLLPRTKDVLDSKPT